MSTAKSRISDLPGNTNKCDPCAFDDSSVDAESFCVDCVEYLCGNCLIHHKKIKATRQHKVFTKERMPVNKKPFEKLQLVSRCSNHMDLDVQFKCLDHDQCICVRCERSVHLKCQKIILVDIEKENIDRERDKIRNHISKIKHHKISVVQTELEDRIFYLNKEKARILEQRQKLVESLESAKIQLENITTQFDLEAQRTIDILLKDLRTIEAFRETERETESFLKIVLEHGTPNQQFVAADQICNANTDKVNLDRSHHYWFNDTLEVHIGGIVETLSKMGRKVNIVVDSKMAKHGSILRSSDGIDDLEEDEPVKPNPSSETLEEPGGKPETLSEIKDQQKVKNGKQSIALESGTSTIVMEKELSETSLAAEVNEVGVRVNKKIFREVHLKGISGNTHKLSSAVTMTGFCVVIVDSPRVILLLNENFQVIETLKLKAKPVSVCAIENNRVAVLCLEKLVRKYEINKKGFRKYHEFQVNENCSCITTYGECEIAFLYAGKFSKTTKLSKEPKVRVEICDHFTGIVRIIIPIEIIPKSVAKLSIFSPALGELIISDGNVLKFFSEAGKDSDVFNSQGTCGITGDNDGNIYIFNSIHNSVVVTSKMNKKIQSHRVTSKFGSATICYDSKRNGLILIGI